MSSIHYGGLLGGGGIRCHLLNGQVLSCLNRVSEHP